ncbi:hypothetical protein BCR35DRAFT_330281 [Leucosporidium creatinivorum]|uniref:F-box domain-containing protein n=1 Tax=Leucosporidium creatinivorum TaxID=106004 RepID=A0A1Y2FY10_9BASI|nr:hypothetical protein BCR35DRAFT_330281 [Leucosporidium creatinivorum]
MSTETDDFASAPIVEEKSIPSLPIELQRRILLLALPRLSFDTFKERYKLLCTASLVNKAWRELALREMMRHPYFRRIRTQLKFLEVAARVDPGFSAEGEGSPKGWIESVWTGGTPALEGKMKVVSLIPYSVKLWVSGKNARDRSAPMVVTPNVSELYCIPCTGDIALYSQIERERFALRTLAACNAAADVSLVELSTAPHLNKLFLLRCWIVTNSQWTDFRRAPPPPPRPSLLNQARFPPPSSPPTEMFTNYFSFILDAIKASPPALSNLQRLILPLPRASVEGRAVLDVSREREEIKAICRERRVKMMERAPIEEHSAAGWEASLHEIREEVAWTEKRIKLE